MELTAEQHAKFEDLCAEIKPGEFGRVVTVFTGDGFLTGRAIVTSVGNNLSCRHKREADRKKYF